MLKKILSSEELRFIPTYCKNRQDVLLWPIINELDLCSYEEKVVIKKIFKSFEEEYILNFILLYIDYEMELQLEVEKKEIIFKTIVKNQKVYNRYRLFLEDKKIFKEKLYYNFEYDFEKKDFIKLLIECIDIKKYLNPVNLKNVSKIMTVYEVLSTYERLKQLEDILHGKKEREDYWMSFFNKYWNTLNDTVILKVMKSSVNVISKLYYKVETPNKKFRVIKIIKKCLRNENREEFAAKKILNLTLLLGLEDDVNTTIGLNFLNKVFLMRKKNNDVEYIIDFTAIDWIFNSFRNELYKNVSKDNLILLNMESFNKRYNEVGRDIALIKSLKLGITNVKELVYMLQKDYQMIGDRMVLSKAYSNSNIIKISLLDKKQDEDVLIKNMILKILGNLETYRNEMIEELRGDMEKYLINKEIKVRVEKKEKFIKF